MNRSDRFHDEELRKACEHDGQWMVCWRAMERCADRGWLEWGVSMKYAWIGYGDGKCSGEIELARLRAAQPSPEPTPERDSDGEA